MAKAPRPPSKGDKFDLQRKIGPLPLWGWVVVAIAAYYLYKRYYGEPTSVEVAGAAPGYESGFSDVGSFGGVGGDAGSGAGSGGGGSFPTDQVTTEPPPVEAPVGEELGGGGAPRDRRHKIARIKRKTGRRIAAIKQGGVTTAERGRIQQIKQRRRTRIRRIRGR